MQRTPGSETRSSRDNPPFSGWNAINHVRYPSSPDPTEHDYLAVQSPQSPPWKPSQTNPPITPASDGIKRTGAWLESMAKRRKAAQETVKSASENWEPRSAVVASARFLHSSMFEGSNGTSPLKARQTRIIPGAAPKFRKSPLFIPPPLAKPRRYVQVVIPFRTHITLSPAPEPTIPQPIIEAAPFIQSLVRRSRSRESERIEIDDSCTSSVDFFMEDEVEEEYAVERILNERKVAGETQFLVQWADGYAELDWIAEEDCNCEELIKKYRAAARRRLRNSGACRPRRGPEHGEDRRDRAQRRAEAWKEKVQSEGPRTKQPVRTPPDPKTGRFRRKTASDHHPQEHLGRERPALVRGLIPLMRTMRENTACFSPRPSSQGVVYTRRNEVTGRIGYLRAAAEFETHAREESNIARQRSKGHLTPKKKRNRCKSRQRQSLRPIGSPRQNMQGQHDIPGSSQGNQQSKRFKSKQPESYAQRQKRPFRDREKRRQTVDSPRFERLAHPHPRPQPNHPPSAVRQSDRNPTGPPVRRPRRTAPIHIRFDEDIMIPFKTSPMTPCNNPILPPSSSSTAPTHLTTHNPNPNSCDERLRRARRHEKKSNAPSLLRHEFRSDMSHRHAEALINQTRRSPERALGFSFPCNSVLLSIEKDGD